MPWVEIVSGIQCIELLFYSEYMDNFKSHSYPVAADGSDWLFQRRKQSGSKGEGGDFPWHPAHLIPLIYPVSNLLSPKKVYSDWVRVWLDDKAFLSFTLQRLRPQINKPFVVYLHIKIKAYKSADDTIGWDHTREVPDFFACPEQTIWPSTDVTDVLSCKDGHNGASSRVQSQSARKNNSQNINIVDILIAIVCSWFTS